jgi:hypothetical protein
MEIKYITQAIFNLAPTAEFAFTDNDLTSLEWHNAEIAQPTNAAILKEAQRLQQLPPVEPTIDEKLASVGLSVNDLKAALGL